MKRRSIRLIQIAIVLLVMQLMLPNLMAQSVGSTIKVGANSEISYWNGSIWIAVTPGLPGQSLQFANGIPTWIDNLQGITTNVVTITGTTAISGGSVISDGGASVIARGVCWSTTHNPTITDSHTTDNMGIGSFISNITGLTPGASYYVRAYATSSSGTAYGKEVNTFPVSDIDGNGYDTVHIGTQIWMKQNLNVTHYRNGDAIPNVTDGSWGALTTGAYVDYNNMPVNSETYGRLYNYYTIGDARNVCPTDWHVSTTDEWTTLTNYLGGGDIAGYKLKEAGTAHWDANVGSNESGFTALPGGFLIYNSSYGYMGHYGTWWSSPETSATTANYWYIDGSQSFAYVASDNKNYGFSVRCVKDKAVYDIDGNGYDTVHIGTQIWMKQNLKTTHYRNGDAIANVTDNSAWSNLTSGAYCNYNNEIATGNVYGRLYNFYTVADSRKLCPTGWHVFTNNEWTALINYLGGVEIAGGKLKEVGLAHWNSPNEGASDDYGYSAFGAGYRDYNGIFDLKGYYAYWWTSTQYDATYTWGRSVFYNYIGAGGGLYDKKEFGFSVRCIKD